MIDAANSLFAHADGTEGVRRVTHFSDEFLSSLHSEREAKRHLRTAELDRVASVPTHLADIWLKQGFDIYRETPRAIVERLKRDGLTAFITTHKQV